jgi:hypothetical protein
MAGGGACQDTCRGSSIAGCLLQWQVICVMLTVVGQGVAAERLGFGSGVAFWGRTCTCIGAEAPSVSCRQLCPGK